MAIAFRSLASSSVNWNSKRTSFVVSKPTGAVVGDLVYAVVLLFADAASAPSFTTPSGWTASQVTFSSSDPWANRLVVMTKPYDGEASWTFTHGSGWSGGVVVAFSGVDLTSPLDTTTFTSSKDAGSGSGQPTLSGMTTATDGAVLVAARQSWDGLTSTAPANWTERWDEGAGAVWTREIAAAGSVGSTTFPSGNNHVNNPWGLIVVALRPAGDEPDPITATGAVTAPKATGSGTARTGIRGNGVAAAAAGVVAASASLLISAAGASAPPPPEASGSAATGIAATGSGSAAPSTATGSAGLEITATGSGESPAPTSSGTVALAIAATGSATAPPATGSGTAQYGSVITATGSVDAPAPTGSGTASLALSATSSATAPGASGEGSARTLIAATGSGTAPAATGSGTVDLGETITGHGSAVAAPATGFGVASLTITGAGFGVAPAATGHGRAADPPVTPPERTATVAAETRTHVVPAGNQEAARMTRTSAERTTFTLDPDARLDFGIDWSAWLQAGEKITNSEWLPVAGLTTENPTHDDQRTLVWVKDGTKGATVGLTNRITTDQGRTDDRTLRIFIMDR